ncbi:hypothetical protein, partial [Enterocloster citroniae]
NDFLVKVSLENPGDMPIGRMPYDFLRYDYHTTRNPVKQAFLILNPSYILAPVLLKCYIDRN